MEELLIRENEIIKLLVPHTGKDWQAPPSQSRHRESGSPLCVKINKLLNQENGKDKVLAKLNTH